MAYLLRHGAEKEKIPIDKGGYVLMSDLLKFPEICKLGTTE
jgi:RNA:NAD 2'-phosphotransferase (TPT1/KptA family)